MPTQTGSLDLSAQKSAHDEAAKVATNYISVDSTGLMVADGDGTETPSTATTRNVFIDADSVDIRDGQESRASFGETVRLGKEYVSGATDNEAHAVLDYRSFALKTKGDSNFFIVGDKRDRDGYIVETFAADMQVTLSSIPDTIESVKVGGTETSNWYLYHDREIIFNFTPSGRIEVTYTTSETPYYLTFGIRDNSTWPGYGYIGALSAVFGLSVSARDYCTFAAGRGAAALAEAASAFNSGIAKGKYSHAEGYGTANGELSHAEGYQTAANYRASHAEGNGTTANAGRAHAEGYQTTANADSSHAEGNGTTANGSSSHAEGSETTAGQTMLDEAAHAEGISTKAYDVASHAQNIGTWANKTAQTTLGTYNVKDTASTTTHPGGNSGDISGSGTDDFGDYAVIVGNGTAEDARSNALTVDWGGNVEAAGEVKAGGSTPLVPIGTILDFAAATPPTGYLACNGQAVSRTDYAALFAVIGTTWGSGDGSTTFNLPDFRGRTSIGAGTGTATDATAHALASSGGAETHKLTESETPVREHKHGFTTPSLSNTAHTHPINDACIISATGTNATTGYASISASSTGSKMISHSNRANVSALSGKTWSTAARQTGARTATTSISGGSVNNRTYISPDSASSVDAHNNMAPFATVTKIIRAI